MGRGEADGLGSPASWLVAGVVVFRENEEKTSQRRNLESTLINKSNRILFNL